MLRSVVKAELINQLLWPFKNLPESYVVVDTETTGLFDEQGAPGIVSLGLAMVRKGSVAEATEYRFRPHRPMTEEAFKVNGISNEQAQGYPLFSSHWTEVYKWLTSRLVVIHNAEFDWPLIIDHVERYQVEPPFTAGVFCSQRAAQPWARAMGLKCSERGPSLDTLTQVLKVEDFRRENSGIHGATIDARQTAAVVEALRDRE
ncbi:MAG: 3'-5' exonuclease [Gammaproteobacteria bacterium]|nr:3'-5' exonuclease [Gammaproteobacteria bacterium]MCF6363175.1 3'-5' exonuclease [Gammaproteobacteria bacterium]